jgi:hypothetical protein
MTETHLLTNRFFSGIRHSVSVQMFSDLSNQPPTSRSSRTASCCITAPCTLSFFRPSRVGVMQMAFSLRLRRHACRHLCLIHKNGRMPRHSKHPTILLRALPFLPAIVMLFYARQHFAAGIITGSKYVPPGQCIFDTCPQTRYTVFLVITLAHLLFFATHLNDHSSNSQAQIQNLLRLHGAGLKPADSSYFL